ncbi:hypothetical protein BH23ACT6_BH23ACT6_16930 [soil metagenome]
MLILSGIPPRIRWVLNMTRTCSRSGEHRTGPDESGDKCCLIMHPTDHARKLVRKPSRLFNRYTNWRNMTESRHATYTNGATARSASTTFCFLMLLVGDSEPLSQRIGRAGGRRSVRGADGPSGGQEVRPAGRRSVRRGDALRPGGRRSVRGTGVRFSLPLTGDPIGVPAAMRGPPAYLEELTCPCCIPALGEFSEVPPHGGPAGKSKRVASRRVTARAVKPPWRGGCHRTRAAWVSATRAGSPHMCSVDFCHATRLR